MFAEVLCSGDYPQCLAELEEVALSSLWPKNSTLRALSSLLTAEDPQLNKAVADYLSSAPSHSHFRTRVSSLNEKRVRGKCMCACVCVETNAISDFPDRCHKPHLNVFCLQAVECYTQALSEAGIQSQRAACSALSCLQVSGLLPHMKLRIWEWFRPLFVTLWAKCLLKQYYLKEWFVFIVKGSGQNEQPYVYILLKANMRVEQSMTHKSSLFPCQATAEGYFLITACRVGFSPLHQQ